MGEMSPVRGYSGISSIPGSSQSLLPPGTDKVPKPASPGSSNPQSIGSASLSPSPPAGVDRMAQEILDTSNSELLKNLHDKSLKLAQNIKNAIKNNENLDECLNELNSIKKSISSMKNANDLKMASTNKNSIESSQKDFNFELSKVNLLLNRLTVALENKINPDKKHVELKGESYFKFEPRDEIIKFRDDNRLDKEIFEITTQFLNAIDFGYINSDGIDRLKEMQNDLIGKMKDKSENFVRSDLNLRISQYINACKDVLYSKKE